jgi:hypothetical protein
MTTDDLVLEIERLKKENKILIDSYGSLSEDYVELQHKQALIDLNKFAIEQQVKFGRDLLENKLEWCEEIGSVQVSDIDWEVQKLEEQLRKEQE